MLILKAVPTTLARCAVHTETRKTALDRGRTDRISLTYDLDLDLQSPASYGGDLLTCKIQDEDQFVPKIEWKQTDGTDRQTDGRTETMHYLSH